MAFLHPKWMGKVENGSDAALLRLPNSLEVPAPLLATQSFRLYPNFKVYGFQLGDTLRLAQFEVVPNQICPKLSTLGNNTFCAFSRNASMSSGMLSTNYCVWYITMLFKTSKYIIIKWSFISLHIIEICINRQNSDFYYLNHHGQFETMQRLLSLYYKEVHHQYPWGVAVS